MNANKVDLEGSRAPLNIQAIIFQSDKHTTQDARKWLKKHDFTPIKRVHTTTNFHRYRIREPEDFQEKTFRLIPIGDGSIEFVIAKLKENKQ
jgi:hypothetical protein